MHLFWAIMFGIAVYWAIYQLIFLLCDLFEDQNRKELDMSAEINTEQVLSIYNNKELSDIAESVITGLLQPDKLWNMLNLTQKIMVLTCFGTSAIDELNRREKE